MTACFAARAGESCGLKLFRLRVSHHAKIITRDARPAREVPAERHNDGAKWGFLDGHAKWMRIEQTLPPVNTYRISRD